MQDITEKFNGKLKSLLKEWNELLSNHYQNAGLKCNDTNGLTELEAKKVKSQP